MQTTTPNELTFDNLIEIARHGDSYLLTFEAPEEVTVNVATPVYTGNTNAKGQPILSRRLAVVRPHTRIRTKRTTQTTTEAEAKHLKALADSAEASGSMRTHLNCIGHKRWALTLTRVAQ